MNDHICSLRHTRARRLDVAVMHRPRHHEKPRLALLPEDMVWPPPPPYVSYIEL